MYKLKFKKISRCLLNSTKNHMWPLRCLYYIKKNKNKNKPRLGSIEKNF